MGIFSERDLDLREMDAGAFTEAEWMDLQRQTVLTELTNIEGKVDRLLERWTYYDEPPTREQLQGLKADLRYAKKTVR